VVLIPDRRTGSTEIDSRSPPRHHFVGSSAAWAKRRRRRHHPAGEVGRRPWSGVTAAAARSPPDRPLRLRDGPQKLLGVAVRRSITRDLRNLNRVFGGRPRPSGRW